MSNLFQNLIKSSFLLLLVMLYCTNAQTTAPVTNTDPASCLEGQFFNLTLKQCFDCLSGCLRCANNFTCGICKPGFYMNNTALLQKPDPLQPALNFCPPCKVENCNICYQSAPAKCSACKVGFFLNPMLGTCSKCLENCEACPNGLLCGRCLANYTYVPSMISTQPGKCEKCSSNCQQCQSNAVCLYCQPQFFLTKLQQCEACMENCMTCSNATTCYKCAPKMYFSASQKTCVECQESCELCGALGCDRCKIGWFRNTEYSCTQCQDNCMYCLQANQCSKCVSGFYFNPDLKACVKCSSNCLACVGPKSCGECETGFALLLGVCQQCPENCQSCENGVCKQCNKGFQYWINKTDNSQNCRACSDNCDNCLFDMYGTTTCTLCRFGFTFQQLLVNVTITSSISTSQTITVPSQICKIMPGYFVNNTDKYSVQQCSSLFPQCQDCGYSSGEEEDESQLKCKNCTLEYFLNSTGFCDSCSAVLPNCHACTNSSACRVCKSGFTLLKDGSCKTCQIKNCLRCHFDNQTLDEICDYCANGFGFNTTSKQCQSCQEFFNGCGVCGLKSFVNTDSTSTTPLGSVTAPTFTCLQCSVANSFFDIQSKTCTTCQGAISNCQYCGLNISSQIQCFQCASNFYLDRENNVCSNCLTKLSNCLECQQYITQQYISTDSTTNSQQLIKNLTVICTKCDNGYSMNLTTRNCEKISCQPNCLECYIAPGVSHPICLRCNDGFINNFETKSCIKSLVCPLGTFFNGYTCVKCAEKSLNCFACAIQQGAQLNLTSEEFTKLNNTQQLQFLAEQLKPKVTCTWCNHNFLPDSLGVCQSLLGNKQCPPSCSDCVLSIGSVKCTACKDTFVLDSSLGLCNADCELSGLFGCQHCKLLNADDSSSLTCFACKSGFYINPATSSCMPVPSCETGQVFNIKNGSCISCPEFCDGCRVIETATTITTTTTTINSTNSTTTALRQLKCDVCASKYKLDAAGNCIYYSENFVQQCSYGCSKCAYSTKLMQMECSECKTGFSLEVASLNGISTIQCKLYCPSNCQYCSINTLNVTVCNVCNQGFALTKENKCVVISETCLSNQFYDPNTLTCRNCTLNCQKCFWDTTAKYARCIWCASLYKLTTDLYCRLKLNSTEPSCPQTYYEDPVKGQCEKCGDKCQECKFQADLDQQFCTKCMFGYSVDQNSGLCVFQEEKEDSTTSTDSSTTTSSGSSTNSSSSSSTTTTTNNPTGGSGSTTGTGTETSTGSTSTTTPVTKPTIQCLEGFFLTERALYILSNSQDVTLLASLTVATACLACPVGCQQCKWNPDIKLPFCFKCLNDYDYFLTEKGFCLNTQCPVSTIFNPSSGCEKCPDRCKTCERTSTGGLSCTECISGFKPNSVGVCEFDSASCPASTMSVGTYCKKCPELCTACSFNKDTNATICSSCLSDYVVEQGQCRKNCEVGKYFGAGGLLGLFDCHNCPTGCTACNQNLGRIVCTDCNKTLNLQLNETLGKCIQPLAVKPNTTNTTTTTNSTTKPAVQLCESNKATVIGEDGSFYCKDCPTGCSTCFYDKTQQDLRCSACINNFIMNNITLKCNPNITSLTLTCKEGQRLDYVNKKCIDCPVGCSKCLTTSTKRGFTCTLCDTPNGFVFRDDYCYLQCDQGKMPVFQADSTQTCKECTAPCTNCKMNYISSPPTEVCFACENGFYIQNQACQIVPTCPEGQFTGLQPTGYANFTSFCIKCPYGCTTCSCPDITKPFLNIKCTVCKDNFILNDQNLCIANYQLQKPTCTVNQTLFLQSNNVWACVACPKGCNGCEKRSDGNFTCLACYDGFFASKNSDGLKTCQQLPVCKTAEYPASDDSGATFTCQTCPTQCSSCNRKNILDSQSLICLTCSTGFKKNAQDQCEKVYTVGSVIPSNACSQNEFPGVYDGFIKCQSCPDICTVCGFSDPTKPSDTTFSCSSCVTGYQVFEGKCIQTCQSGQYFSIADNQCLSCDFPCISCLNAVASECQVCAEGFQLVAGFGCDVIVQKTELDCGTTAVYSASEDACKCLDATQIFNPATVQCYTTQQWLQLNDCGAAQYKDIATNECRTCQSKDADNLCIACTGGQPADCISCPLGYFFNKETYSCDSCPVGCDVCSSTNSCTQCSIGTFEFISIDSSSTSGQKMQCLSACPSGTLPSVLKFYLQNKDKFSEQELSDIMDLANQPLVNQTYVDDIAIAIGIQSEPVYDEVPWSYNTNGQPTYLDQLVKLSCSACQSGCASCYGEEYLDTESKKCYKDKCPPGLVKKFADYKNLCSQAAADQIAIDTCSQVTVSKDSNSQSNSRNYFVNCSIIAGTTALRLLATKTINYTWSIVEVKKDNVGLQKEGIPITNVNDDFENSEKQQIKMKLFNGLKTNKTSLEIPAENLKKNVQYKIQFTAQLGNKTANHTLSFFVRNEETTKSLDELITPDLITVSPQSGISGETVYTLQYTLDNGNENLKFFKADLEDQNVKSWKITAKIGENGPQYSNFLLNNKIKFQIPPNTKNDSDIEILFVISNGNSKFIAKRKVTALKNQNFDISKSSMAEKLQSGTSTPSDLASAASTVKAQLNDNSINTCPNLKTKLENLDGPCTLSEGESACCGHGTCIQGQTSKYVCNCTESWAGQACQVPFQVQKKMQEFTQKIMEAATKTPVTQENVDTLLNSLQTSAQSSSFNASTSTATFNKLKEIGQHCTDSNMLSNVLDSITATKKATTFNNSKTNDTTEVKETQKIALEAMKSAFAKFSTTLDPSKKEAVVSAPGIAGKSKFVDTTELKPNDIITTSIDNISVDQTTGKRILTVSNQVKTEISLKPNVFGSQQSATVAALQLPHDTLSSMEGGKQIISKNLEISLNAKDGTKIDVSNISGVCPIQFVIQATVSGKNKIAKCKYFDQVESKFTDKGCNTTNQTLGNNDYKITCCCNHLTTFAIVEDMNNNNTSSDQLSQTYVPIYGKSLLFSAILLAITTIFALC